jgi:hypothetical protein
MIATMRPPSCVFMSGTTALKTLKVEKRNDEVPDRKRAANYPPLGGADAKIIGNGLYRIGDRATIYIIDYHEQDHERDNNPPVPSPHPNHPQQGSADRQVPIADRDVIVKAESRFLTTPFVSLSLGHPPAEPSLAICSSQRNSRKDAKIKVTLSECVRNVTLIGFGRQPSGGAVRSF